jgi:hypothetical protein
MTVAGQSSNFKGSGAAAATAKQSPMSGPNRSEQRLPGVPVSGRPGPPASRAAAHTAGRIDLGEAIPVWLAALIAASCQAAVNGTCRAIEWYSSAGRAVYTNSGGETELIHPLGIHLGQGDTLAVSWMPGQTEYSFEVLRQADYGA